VPFGPEMDKTGPVNVRVLVNAGPWVAVPPRGYGGIETVVADLVTALRARGAEVVVATVAESTVEADGRIAVFEKGQFENLIAPYRDVMGIAHAHMHAVVAAASERGFDVVHDHLEVVGASMLAALGPGGPPVLQTLHWDLRRHPDFYATFDGAGRVFFNALSERQLDHAPANLRRQVVGVVPLGVAVDELPFESAKGSEFVVLARITPDKGQDIAARVCRRLGVPLVLAGPVAGVPRPDLLAERLAEPASPMHQARDVRFFGEAVEPLLDGDVRRWIGTVTGQPKLELLGRARAALFPVRWDEPGGTAVVEALACGTPVVGMRRGCLATIVEHGVTGFLADDEDELASFLQRVDEIDPAACRRAAEERFTAGTMADRYLELYAAISDAAGAGVRW
jgi:glycosyltransferase involved in cell wall biosynthesis